MNKSASSAAEPQTLISVIIPTFNRSSDVIRCVKSLLVSSLQSFEVIVVDDGSTDDTLDSISLLSDPRLKIYSIKNSERGFARNYGFSLSLGRYVNFFDSDDFALPNHIGEAFCIISEFPRLPIFAFGWMQLQANATRVEVASPLSNIDFRRRLLYGNPLSVNSVFLSREVFSSNRFSEDRLLSGTEDYELWFRLSSLYDFTFFNKITTVGIDHSGRSVTISDDSFVERILFFCRSLQANQSIERGFGKTGVKTAVVSSYFYILLNIATSPSQRVNFRRVFLALMRLSPLSLLGWRSIKSVVKHLFLSK